MVKDAKTPLLPSNVESSTKPKRIFVFGIIIVVLMSLSYWYTTTELDSIKDHEPSYYRFKLKIGDSTYLCSDGRCTSPADALVITSALLFVVAPVLLFVVAKALVLLFVVALAPVLLLVVGPVLLMVVPFVYSDYFYDHFHDFKIYELGK